MGHVDDVARWVGWLAASDTEWTTGNVIHVDGGQVLGIPGAAGG
jgi:NAD(P)-dependent dehydrogenase (short-subunit alcohol dehydrogenase family)